MTLSEVTQAVEAFFADNSHAGLVLPSGWFGRPYDNLHRLTECTAEGSTVRVELDGQHQLSFEGGALLAVREPERLTLRGFATLTWDWRSYGSLEEHHEIFSGGEVAFVALLG